MELKKVMPGDSFSLELTGIQMRMRQQAREIISNVFLSEEETRQLLGNELNRVVASVNWEKMLREELESTLRHEISNLVKSMTSTLLWDKEVRAIMKERLINSLRAEGEI